MNEIYMIREKQLKTMLKQELEEYEKAVENRDISSLNVLHGWIEEHIKKLKIIETYIEEVSE